MRMIDVGPAGVVSRRIGLRRVIAVPDDPRGADVQPRRILACDRPVAGTLPNSRTMSCQRFALRCGERSMPRSMISIHKLFIVSTCGSRRIWHLSRERLRRDRFA